MFNATFNSIPVISWRPVLLVEEAGIPGENHRLWERNWYTFSHKYAASQLHLNFLDRPKSGSSSHHRGDRLQWSMQVDVANYLDHSVTQAPACLFEDGQGDTPSHLHFPHPRCFHPHSPLPMHNFSSHFSNSYLAHLVRRTIWASVITLCLSSCVARKLNSSEGGPVFIFKCGSRKEKYLGSVTI